MELKEGWTFTIIWILVSLLMAIFFSFGTFVCKVWEHVNQPQAVIKASKIIIESPSTVTNCRFVTTEETILKHLEKEE